MLYQLGPLTLDTFPFSAEGVEREIKATSPATTS